ncbi:MAG: glycosyltransferase [Stygiobacter sp.]|uniref:Glycosyltransferase n=1 Tax=Stygiobacter electus TaxID=3032292 RepID=A0AAE3NYL5_9BACT|nr:glycosyltransferase [Stygiobacter electus]MDF1611127.1 glycosyltransferase [Stygiobacter electus]
MEVLDEIVLFTYIFSLMIILIYGSHGFVMMYYHRKYRKNIPKPKELQDEPMVTIQLPMYNELYVVERLINAVCDLDYPKEKLEIQVLDDSTDETVELVAKIVKEKQALGYDIQHIRRENRTGFKAGALKEGLKSAKGKYVAIFDADFIPKKNFLRYTLPYFTDEKIGLVQTRWEHLNEDYSILTKIQALALNGHFVIEQTVRNKAGFFIQFNGTGGVWLKECIEDAGNWHADTLTEDLDLSYRAQLKGWKFIYLRDFTTPAELPVEMNALKAQQFRWTKGAIETSKKLLPMVWKSKIPLRVKLQATFNLTNNFVFPFTLLAAILNVPLIFIKNAGPYWNFFNFMAIFVIAFISTFLFYLFAQKDVYEDWRKRIALFPLFMAGSMGFTLNNTRAVIEGLMSRKSEFVRTPKYKVEKKSDTVEKNKYLAKTKIQPSTYIELLLAAYCFIGVSAAVYFMEIAAIPFQFMFFFGFATVSFMSLRQTYLKRQQTTQQSG